MAEQSRLCHRLTAPSWRETRTLAPQIDMRKPCVTTLRYRRGSSPSAAPASMVCSQANRSEPSSAIELKRRHLQATEPLKPNKKPGTCVPGLFPREVNGLGELPVLKRIVKRYPLGARLGKDRGKPLCERL